MSVTSALPADLADLVGLRRGHFQFESGHHGDLWLNLETLCSHPNQLDPFVRELAHRLTSHRPEIICGPLNEGAFVGLLVARELRLEFCYTEPHQSATDPTTKLYPVGYRLPHALRERVHQRRVAIVNDVINAGSAVRGTFAALDASGANIVAIGALLVLGSWSGTFATEHNIPLESLAQSPNNLWMPSECPLCAAGISIERPPSL